MLDTLCQDFELILFTCGGPSYAHAIADTLESIGQKKYFDFDKSMCESIIKFML